MKRKTFFLTRLLIYLLASLVPPALIGAVGMPAAEAARYATPPAVANGSGEVYPAPPTHDAGKPTAVVVLSNAGSEVTDVLAPYQVLAESGAFNVYVAAPERRAVTLSGGLEILPQLSLAELHHRLGGKNPDVIVVPAMWGVGSPAHRPVAEWLREHAAGSGTVVSVCDGAKVLADAGLLGGRRATANWARIEEWERRYPDTEWVRGLRYVEDGNVVTSAGVTSGVSAILRVIRGHIGDEAAAGLARKIGYPDQRLGDEPQIPADRLTASDRALYMLSAAFGWGKPKVGVLLTEGTSEIELASVLDVYPGPAFNANATTLTAGDLRSPVRSEHGLYFVPRSGLADAPGLDRLLVPGRTAPSVTDPGVRSWARERGLELEFIHADAPVGFPFDATLSDLARHENAPMASFTHRLLEYPLDHLDLAGGGWPLARLLRPLAVGLLGLAIAVLADRLLGAATRRLRRAPAEPVANAQR